MREIWVDLRIAILLTLFWKFKEVLVTQARLLGRNMGQFQDTAGFCWALTAGFETFWRDQAKAQDQSDTRDD